MPDSDSNAYGESWYAATAVASPLRPRLTAETDVDVCVIGGGLAGLTVAHEVARRGWSVLVLERNSLAWNASGRNSGFVVPGFSADIQALVERVGFDHAKELWALSEAGAEYVRNTARQMPGAELSEGGWLHVSKSDRTAAMARRHDLLTGAFGASVEAWPAEWVRHELRSPLYFDALHYPRGFSIHPFNYALGLAAAAEAAGARIYGDTPALQIDPVGVRKRIVIQDARVRAGHVVLAGNVHLGGLLPEFATTLLPVHGYTIVTESLGRAVREYIHFGGAVSDTEMADNHYRVVGGDRLLWSGRSTVWRGRPRRYAQSLLHDLVRAYPPFRGVKAEYVWSGTVGQTVHSMPQIGEISPGLWLLSGFGGHGLNTTAMGGELLARAIVDGDSDWRLFAPFGIVWAGGLFGRVTQQSMYWSLRARDEVEGAVARYRDGRTGHAVEPQDMIPGAVAALPQATPVAPAARVVEPSPPVAPAVAAEPARPAAPVKRVARARPARPVVRVQPPPALPAEPAKLPLPPVEPVKVSQLPAEPAKPPPPAEPVRAPVVVEPEPPQPPLPNLLPPNLLPQEAPHAAPPQPASAAAPEPEPEAPAPPSRRAPPEVLLGPGDFQAPAPKPKATPKRRRKSRKNEEPAPPGDDPAAGGAPPGTPPATP